MVISNRINKSAETVQDSFYNLFESKKELYFEILELKQIFKNKLKKHI